MDSPQVLHGRYQESLRAIGAWLDIRGFSDVRIVEDDGDLVVEAALTAGEPATTIERIRLDSDSIGRLCRAARNDRGAALSYRPVEYRFPATLAGAR